MRSSNISFYCHDINECDMNPAICDSNAGCQNNVGSFSCTCNEGYSFDENTLTCENIDECNQENQVCGAYTECKDNDGSFLCDCLDDGLVLYFGL